MNNSSIVRFVIAVVLFTSFECLTHAAVIKDSPKIHTSLKILDPSKRHLDKENHKIYRIITEHIGQRKPSAKASNDSPKYDSIEIEEKKISSVQEVATSALDVKYTRKIDEPINPYHPERNIPFLKNSNINNGKLLTDLEGNSYQPKKSRNPDQKQFNKLDLSALKFENSERYKLPHTSLPNKHPVELSSAKVLYKNNDQEDDDELNSDYDDTDLELEDTISFQTIPNQIQISTKVYEKELTEIYEPTEIYKEYYKHNYTPTKLSDKIDRQSKITYNKREDKKNSFIHNYKKGKLNHDLRSTTYKSLQLGSFEQFISKYNLNMSKDDLRTSRKRAYESQITTSKRFLKTEKVGNSSHVHFINNTGGETIIEEGPLEIDIKTDPSTGKLNFRFKPDQGPNITLKIERRSLSNAQNQHPQTDDNISRPLIKFYDNPGIVAPWKLNHMHGNINLSVIERPFKHVDGGNGVFYVGDKTKHLVKRDSPFMQTYKPYTIMTMCIMILIVALLILFLLAIYILGRRSINGSFNFGGPKWKQLKYYSNLSEENNTTDSREKEITDEIQPEDSEDVANVLRDIINEETKRPRNTRHVLIASETDFRKPPEQQSIDRNRDSRRSKLKNLKFRGSNWDLESILNCKAEQSTDFRQPPKQQAMDGNKDRRRSNFRATNADLESTFNYKADQSTDLRQPPKQQQPLKGDKGRSKFKCKNSNFQTFNWDLESIISSKAVQPPADSSIEPSLKPDAKNLKMKMMKTGEVEEIDEMLVGNDMSNHVYVPVPYKTNDQKGSKLENTTHKTNKDLIPVLTTTKESITSLEEELGKSLHKAENVIGNGKPLSKKKLNMERF